jgi:hypothetical protein
MLQWAWAYITRGRSSRLITGSPVARDEAIDDAESRAA